MIARQGRVDMYRLSEDEDMFNLPIRVSHHNYAANMQQSQIAGACITDGHTLFRCVVYQRTAARVCKAVETDAESAGIRNPRVTVNPVPRVARYVRGAKDYRLPDKDASTPTCIAS